MASIMFLNVLYMRLYNENKIYFTQIIGFFNDAISSLYLYFYYSRQLHDICLEYRVLFGGGKTAIEAKLLQFIHLIIVTFRYI